MISIHAPREGSDSGRQASKHRPQHFYPRSPRGERPFTVTTSGITFGFLSTLPARGATQGALVGPGEVQISIHAPREGSDACRIWDWFGASSFLSTLPARGATRRCCRWWWTRRFLSTLPARGATFDIFANAGNIEFLSTLPARGATCLRQRPADRPGHFYPRSPRGERPAAADTTTHSALFLSTLPARGATYTGM